METEGKTGRKFQVIEVYHNIKAWKTFEVEAENEEEAISLVEHGDERAKLTEDYFDADSVHYEVSERFEVGLILEGKPK